MESGRIRTSFGEPSLDVLKITDKDSKRYCNELGWKQNSPRKYVPKPLTAVRWRGREKMTDIVARRTMVRLCKMSKFARADVKFRISGMLRWWGTTGRRHEFAKRHLLFPVHTRKAKYETVSRSVGSMPKLDITTYRFHSNQGRGDRYERYEFSYRAGPTEKN